ncbi:MAG: phenylpyruvate tautomerase MIF-related protein [Oceanidesulfovibrio sp.]
MRIEPNIELDDGQVEDLVAKATSLVTESLGKSERYVMVVVHQGGPRRLRQRSEPGGVLQSRLHRVGRIPCPALAESLCMFLETREGIPQDRIYIEFSDLSRSMVGWNEKTFA